MSVRSLSDEQWAVLRSYREGGTRSDYGHPDDSAASEGVGQDAGRRRFYGAIASDPDTQLGGAFDTSREEDEEEVDEDGRRLEQARAINALREAMSRQRVRDDDGEGDDDDDDDYDTFFTRIQGLRSRSDQMGMRTTTISRRRSRLWDTVPGSYTAAPRSDLYLPRSADAAQPTRREIESLF